MNSSQFVVRKGPAVAARSFQRDDWALFIGVWMAQDHYAGTTLGSALFSITIGAILLLCLRSSCNGIAVPLGTAFDEHHLFFIVPTRFRVKVSPRQ